MKIYIYIYITKVHTINNAETIGPMEVFAYQEKTSDTIIPHD